MIHKFKMFNNFIVLDVESGCIFLVDQLTFNMLDFVDFSNKDENLKFLLKKFSSFSEEEITNRFKELFELFEKGVLFSSFCYDDAYKIQKQTVLKAICLHVAHDCNLRCKYCFAKTGDFKQGRELMDFSVAKAAIDFLIENSKNRKNLEVDFFGGEPLLNFEVVKKTVEYAKKQQVLFNKNFRFTITTNAVLLDSKKIDFINQNMDNVVLSLDGRKDVNERFRVGINNSGNYDLILKNIKNFVKQRKEKDYYVRGTFTSYNLDFLKDVVYFYENGFLNMSIEPVVCDEKKDYAIKKQHLEQIFKEYEKLTEFIAKKKLQGEYINFFHLNVDLTQGPCLVKRLRGCGFGCEYVAVSPNGDVFPCHQLVGEKNFFMGNLLKKSFDQKMREDFSKVNILNKKECLKCWAKYYCSGGCSANGFKFSNSFLKPYSIACKMQKKRIECAIALKAVLLKKPV